MSTLLKSFQKALIEDSESNVLNEAILEWVYDSYRQSKYKDGICICGKTNLVHIFTIKNQTNGTELDIGKDCNTNFEDNCELYNDIVNKYDKETGLICECGSRKTKANNKCGQCRRDDKKTLERLSNYSMKGGKYKNVTYEKLYDIDKRYMSFMRDTNNDTKYVNYLKQYMTLRTEYV